MINYFKQTVYTLTLLLGLILSATAQQATESKPDEALQWYTDIAQAQTVSQASAKPIFAFFTGSDWCGWCKKLQKDVFAKPEFITWAKNNVVLVELDFPRNKKLPDVTVQQNSELQQVFKVSGFPTIWLFYLAKDEASKKFTINALGSLGYPGNAQQGKEEVKFLETANTILAKGK